MSRWFLRLCNGLFSFVTALALVTTLLYSGYALWDNGQIYAAAENVMEAILTLESSSCQASPA